MKFSVHCLLLPSEVKTDTYYVVVTCVYVRHHLSRSSYGALLVEGVHVTEVDAQQVAGIDAKTTTY